LAGLAKAVRHYDPGTGSSWATFARSLIRRAIFDHLRLLDYAGVGAMNPKGTPAYQQNKTAHFCQATTAVA
jgi:DNA-directed RNA polymerase specialized sigma subunit